MVRPRQPINLLEAKGKKHLTKEEIEERKNSEVKAKSDKIKPPSYLNTPELKKEFKKIAKELMDIDIMSNLDCDSLARFIIAQGEYIKITKSLQKLTPTKLIWQDEKNSEGDIIGTEEILVVDENYDALLVMQDRVFKQCRQAASDLGLTISSRCKLVIPKPEEKKKNKFGKFGAANNG